MKRLNWIYGLAIAVITVAGITSCVEDDDMVVFSIESLTAGDGIDLNAATAPTDVPTDASITAVFTKDLDASSVTTDIITLTRDYDDADIELNISASGNTVTISTAEEMGPGTTYLLEVAAGIKATDGDELAGFSRAFTTAGSFAPAGQIAYFNFDDNTDDQVGTYSPASADVRSITFVDGRNANAGKAASFNGENSLIEIPNADDFLASDDFTLSFWIKASSERGDRGQFVMGLAAWYGFQFEMAGDWAWVKLAQRYETAGGDTQAEDNWFNGSGETGENGGWQGWTHHQDLGENSVGDVYFRDQWAHVICTYDATSKVAAMYINGTKVKAHDFNLWPDGDPKKDITGVAYAGNAGGNKLALGFIQGREDRVVPDDWANPDNAGNQFMGELDDIRIFNVALSDAEVTLLHNSEN